MTATSSTQRELTDARTLKALANPIRLALLDALLAGPMTATQAAAVIGQTPTTCSFHLRKLAEHGFVEEAPGRRERQRERPWRVRPGGWRTSRTDDPVVRRAASALDRALLARYWDRLERFVDGSADLPPDWYAAVLARQSVYHLTAAELAELSAAHQAVDDEYRRRYDGRTTDPAARPADSAPVEVLLFAYRTDAGPRS
jgi:DNA-binding transcriptional ArsR family regulator